ncbi:hypothetical protein NEDG_01417 [Nematocida displodere]|uniref:Uncharacterized protein n=1 Tax=Nematocida displodere TaxID=1805483 RepID=A0A177EBL5_9MICR|nr:hypothetical protein NEDG_01417 [Nematocida displodere]
MEEKKRKYEEEIGTILRRVMEVSYLRKKNTEKLGAILKGVRGEKQEGGDNSPDGLVSEYTELKTRIFQNLGVVDSKHKSVPK